MDALAPIARDHAARGRDIHFAARISFASRSRDLYVVDVYKQRAPWRAAMPRFALYILLFPQLIAHLIIRWRDIARATSPRTEQLSPDVKATASAASCWAWNGRC